MNRISFIFLSFGLGILVLLSACSPVAQSAATRSPPTPTTQAPTPGEAATIQSGDIDQTHLQLDAPPSRLPLMEGE